MRKMQFAGRNWTSEAWLAIARGVLFNPEGASPELRKKWKEQGWEYYCSACDRAFHSLCTPTICPHCKGKASDDPQANEVAHYSKVGGLHVAKTFPFFVPDLDRPKSSK